MITEEAKKVYMEFETDFCIFCGSRNIEMGEIEIESDIHATNECLSCGRKWEESYCVCDIREV